MSNLECRSEPAPGLFDWKRDVIIGLVIIVNIRTRTTLRSHFRLPLKILSAFVDNGRALLAYLLPNNQGLICSLESSQNQALGNTTLQKSTLVCPLGALALFQHGIEDFGHCSHGIGLVSERTTIPVADVGMEGSLAETIERHPHGTLNGRVFGIPILRDRNALGIQPTRRSKFLKETLIMLLFHGGKWHGDDVAMLGRDADLTSYKRLRMPHGDGCDERAKRWFEPGGEGVPDLLVGCIWLVSKKIQEAANI